MERRLREKVSIDIMQFGFMPSVTGDAFVCQVCQRRGAREDINIQESMDLGNDGCLDRDGTFYYLGDMLSGGGEVNPVSMMRVWGRFREVSGILTRKDVSLKLRGKVYVTDLCEDCNGL